MRDCIHIERLEMLARIGVPDEERSSAQRLTFNITLWPMCQMQDLNDEIGRRDKLIETLANALARHLLDVFEICKVTIELHKYILPDVEFVSVSVTRERQEK
jgi:phosphoglycolate phosphatase/dihydroneopterin aldolase